MFRLAVLVCGMVSVNAVYIWPSPQLDALEALRWDQSRNGVTNLVQPCNDFVSAGGAHSGRSNAADWIRTAFHDMATYNKTSGTGGMDASIRFAEEQARPEDPGDGFQLTSAEFVAISTRYISVADALAAGTVLAIENCGGPEIAFRGGRVDAAEPNAPGVPQPQDALASHIAAFARQGFSQTEMIGLVACGHTFGGVQQSVFPQIVPVLNDPNNTQSVSHFDSTFATFDNDVATEYISGTTQNPLVVGLNDTTNSDKRIFGSDGNATMLSFANSADLFSSTCAELLARMLDTVPTGVQLTDIIAPLLVKPDDLKLDLSVDGATIQFSTEVRLWDLPKGNHTVLLLWDDHVRAVSNVTLSAADVETASGGRYTASWFNTPILTLRAVAGITNMRFSVDGTVEDQGGIGFPVQDTLMWSKSTCFAFINANTIGELYVAVRNTVTPTRVYVEIPGRDNVSRPIVTAVDLTQQPMTINATYTIWSGQVTNKFTFLGIGAEIDGVTVSRDDLRSNNNFAQCAV
ncbi:heme peroxidase [Mycena alexandri]|uniref:Peroxidase n=1 Tax=Mycena alexandri TaxID=1745969 RepID=A0AAD6SSA5_9AGAR|nr:heme peroxidase [Mycena alexandri]